MLSLVFSSVRASPRFAQSRQGESQWTPSGGGGGGGRVHVSEERGTVVAERRLVPVLPRRRRRRRPTTPSSCVCVSMLFSLCSGPHRIVTYGGVGRGGKRAATLLSSLGYKVRTRSRRTSQKERKNERRRIGNRSSKGRCPRKRPFEKRGERCRRPSSSELRF